MVRMSCEGGSPGQAFTTSMIYCAAGDAVLQPRWLRAARAQGHRRFPAGGHFAQGPGAVLVRLPMSQYSAVGMMQGSASMRLCVMQSCVMQQKHRRQATLPVSTPCRELPLAQG